MSGSSVGHVWLPETSLSAELNEKGYDFYHSLNRFKVWKKWTLYYPVHGISETVVMENL